MQKLRYTHVHIPKTADTTFIHPFAAELLSALYGRKAIRTVIDGVFGANDLRISLGINPALPCITRYSIRPNADLESITPNIRYFTILRDPVKRFISAYLNHSSGFDRTSLRPQPFFLQVLQQVRKGGRIAGCDCRLRAAALQGSLALAHESALFDRGGPLNSFG